MLIQYTASLISNRSAAKPILKMINDQCSSTTSPSATVHSLSNMTTNPFSWKVRRVPFLPRTKVWNYTKKVFSCQHIVSAAIHPPTPRSCKEKGAFPPPTTPLRSAPKITLFNTWPCYGIHRATPCSHKSRALTMSKTWSPDPRSLTRHAKDMVAVGSQPRNARLARSCLRHHCTIPASAAREDGTGMSLSRNKSHAVDLI